MPPATARKPPMNKTMEQKIANDNVPATISEAPAEKFKGYSMEDLRYRRALVTIQKEYAKARIHTATNKMKSYSPFSPDFGKGHGKMGKAGAVAGKLLNGFNYLDYIMLGTTLFSTGKKIFGLFRRKKK